MGRVPQPAVLRDLAARLKQFLSLEHLHYVGRLDARIERVAVACGAAGEFLPQAREAGCDLLVLGETNLHTCLEAEATEVCAVAARSFRERAVCGGADWQQLWPRSSRASRSGRA